MLKGRWHYLEHDWKAEEGGYVYEPPSETHTLLVPDDVDEMFTYFQVNGVMCYVDPWGKVTGYEDVSPKSTFVESTFLTLVLVKISSSNLFDDVLLSSFIAGLYKPLD